MTKQLLLCALLGVWSLAAVAQKKVNLHLKNGSVMNVYLSELDSMTITDDGSSGGDNDPEQQTVTGDATDVTGKSATIVAYANNILDNESSDLKVGIIYCTSGTPNKSNGTQRTVSTSSIGSDGRYSITLSGLTFGTTYYYRSFVYQSGVWFYGKVKSFTTLDNSSQITFSGTTVTNITCFSAKFSTQMTVSIDPSAVGNLSSYGVCLDTIPEPTTKQPLSGKDGNGMYSTTLHQLLGGTIYYYRPYAVLDGTTCYGATSSFRTQADNVVTTGDMAEDGSVRSTLTIGGGAYSSLLMGLCWSTTNAVPTVSDSHSTTNEVDDDNCYTLTPNVYGTIYYRAYILIDNVAHYGETKSYERKYDCSGDTKEYVDLGLPSGTLWATCNVGADNPEDYGDYFAWGETTPQISNTYNWSSYKWCSGSSSSTMIKYSTSTSYWDSSLGTAPDQKTELDVEDDAAYVNWGSDWRMPSYDQIEELINSSYTTTTWTTENGVYGRRITSKTNSNSIFLPAAGCRRSSSLDDAGSYGEYWSRSLITPRSYCAYDLVFYSGNIHSNDYNRYCGFSVRPVRASQK